MPLPHDPVALAAWFSEGINSEIGALGKDGGGQKYELLSGKMDELSSATFRFVIADGTNVPEDSTGALEAGGTKFNATVVRQQENFLFLRLEGDRIPTEGISRAILTIDDTMLLRRMSEALQKIAISSSAIGQLSCAVFHPNLAKVGSAVLPPTHTNISGEDRKIIEKACGSSVTYLWGPPGTGKTYTIAHLIAFLVELGERVLIVSHTNAAVDQALYEAVKNEAGKDKGPLAESRYLSEYRLLRLGLKADDKIPHAARFAKAVEQKAKGITEEILSIEQNAGPLLERRNALRNKIADWAKLDELTRMSSEMQGHLATSVKSLEAAVQLFKNRNRDVGDKKAKLEKARNAWLFQKSKTGKALSALESAERFFADSKDQLVTLQSKHERLLRTTEQIMLDISRQEKVCELNKPKADLEQRLSALGVELNPIEEKLAQLHELLSGVEKELLDNAMAIFCTMTKCYMGKELEGQSIDAVIIDEASMALPPLVFLAASIAKKRVIVVGDFLQLPPVVRSDSEVSSERLKTDVFHLAGVARDMKPVTTSSVLQRLSVQRRMLPQISAVANYLVYTRARNRLEDHPSTINRSIPAWLNLLPENPLVIVDTADLNCWCGKQAGSLSRFNFYSAIVAVGLASFGASHISSPDKNASKPIGIVTPYAAQRRLLVRLVHEMGLDDWVMAGTVHTFQGGQAEMIIFDAVLDEPYWSARLCSPKASDDVKRDLNVAVTRARSKFVFLGSSAWMNRHARLGSALGDMWAYMKNHAELHSAVDLVETPLHQSRTGLGRSSDGTWSVPLSGGLPTHDILNEVEFFDRFIADIDGASKEIFGLVPFFGEYRWPRVHPSVSNALRRGVAITLVTPPLSEVRDNKGYVVKAVKNLRDLGAVVAHASGLHGKEAVIDERIHYLGSLNWASHRGNNEIMHRIESEEWAKTASKYLQTRYIRNNTVQDDGTPRTCPNCKSPTGIVNQRRQHGAWDKQSVKIGCSNPNCEGYLRPIDERPPYRDTPRCNVDGITKKRKIQKGRGQVWECPKHSGAREREKYIPGDP